MDKVDLTIYPDNPDAADKHLKAGDTDLEADGGVQATLQAQIAADPKLKANADNPATGFTRYLVVFQTVAPLTNADCRKAIFYAINKSDLQLARGGTSAGDDRVVDDPARHPRSRGALRVQPVPGRFGQHR